jgi:sterol desaturase/sphingolipid hydroxylase (fatty acid hydroxylase superfamily)
MAEPSAILGDLPLLSLMGPAIQGTAIVGFTLVGRLLPRVADQALFHKDLMWNLVNGALLYPLRITLVAWVAAHSNLHLLPTDWLPGPIAQAALAFVTLDLARYWLHRLAHRIPTLWSFHRVHHSAERLEPTAGLRMHLVDFLLLSSLPILLFGVLFDTSGWHPAVLPGVLAIGVFFDAFQHANLRWNPNNPLSRAWGLVLNNPLFHSWHHTRDGHLIDGNYGNTLVIWDKLLGTEVTRPVPPAAYGIQGDQALQNDPLSWQLLRARGGAQ